MDRRKFLMQLGLGSAVSTLHGLIINNSSGTAQPKTSNKEFLVGASITNNFVNVYQFGTLVSGETNKEHIRIANAKIFQKAIDFVGKQGGGTIYIPTGYYQVSPEILTGDSPSSIVINYDNITLSGDGIGKTIIETRGSWSLMDNRVVRGNGIMIKGTNNSFYPRKNITIKNLELCSGITGFTGNRAWPANTNTGDGWDITHKGIVLDFNKYLDNITIDSVYVHDFRGELIYAGGLGVGKVIISNTKFHSSNASMLSLDANLTVTKCEFSQTANAWVENAPISRNKSYYFDGCIFKDSIASGLVIAQGTFPSGHKVTVTNCIFYNSPSGICPFGGASNFVITKNKFFDINNALFTSGVNKNIEFYQNEIYGQLKAVSTAHIFGDISNLVIRDNYHQSSIHTNVTKVACIFYYGHLKNIVIENNIFRNCRTPEKSSHLTNERPLFRNNQYINVEKRDSQGIFSFYEKKTSYFFEPKFEEAVLKNITEIPVLQVSIRTDRYVDGQIVAISGGNIDAQLKLPQSSSTIQCQKDRYLTGQGEQVRLKFKKSDNKWYEV